VCLASKGNVVIYKVKLCTRKAWLDPVPIEKDWRLKDWQKIDNRISLAKEAQDLLGLEDEEITAWTITIS
jgi:hypothetical protein